MLCHSHQPALEWASADLKILQHAMVWSSQAMQWASDDLKGDRAFVLNAVSEDWAALRWASDELKGDREILLIAVSQRKGWAALEWASERLKGDREIILNAMRLSETRIDCFKAWRRWASSDLKGDREFLLKAVTLDSDALEWALDEDDFCGDREIILNAVTKSWFNLALASDDLKRDREIILHAVSQDWRALDMASDELLEDQQIIEKIMLQTDFKDRGLLLKVLLLSGRCCTGAFKSSDDVVTVLRRCSEKLDLDRDQVVAMGKLVHLGETEGTGMVRSLSELQPGQMHLVTLVLSSHEKA